MATRNDIDKDLTLELDGTHITSQKFQKGIQAFFNLLDNVSKSLNPKRKIQWNVQVKSGSNLVGVEAVDLDPVIVQSIFNKVQQDVRLLESGDLEGAKNLDESSLNNVRTLATLAGDDTIVKIWSFKQPTLVTHKSIASVKKILKDSYEDYGSITGWIGVVSCHKKIQATIYDDLWEKAIYCLGKDDMINEALKYFNAENRVEVYGVIKYKKSGQPESITVEEMVAYPKSEKIPSADTIKGLLKGYEH